MSAKFAIYDVFADRPFGGNQAAVVRSKGDFSDRQLLAVAAEFSLPETALSVLRGKELVLRFATADRLVRRCGHATLAAVADHVFSRIARQYRPDHTWSGKYRVGTATAQWRARALQPTKAGAVAGMEIAVAWPDRPRFVRPLLAAIYKTFGLESRARAPELPLCVYDSGNLNALIPVQSVVELQEAKPDWQRLTALFTECGLTDAHLYCLLGWSRFHSQLRLRCRNVFPYGSFEETATGTASVALAASLVDHLPFLRDGTDPIYFQFDQGMSKRRGKIRVNWYREVDRKLTIWLEGRVFPIMRGFLIPTPAR